LRKPIDGQARRDFAALAILIQDLRKHKKYTLKELADKIGRSVGFLSQVERGLSRPTVADLTAISETLGVPTTYFYSLPKPMSLALGDPAGRASHVVLRRWHHRHSWFHRRCVRLFRCWRASSNRARAVATGT
jgi:transcriptional regulator with XRE-family HTH domain